MEIQGKVILILPEERFNGRNGEVVRHSFVVETFGQYPKKVKFDVLKPDTWQRMNVTIGTDATISFDVESREWQGRWFSSLIAWRVSTGQQSSSSGGGNNTQQQGGTDAPY